MKFPGHGDARDFVLMAFVSVAGLGLFLFIPQHIIPPGGAAAGIVVLLVLKHVGLLAAIGAAVTPTVRNRLLPWLKRRTGGK